jgi:hypothetical protein
VDLPKLIGELGAQSGTDKEFVRWFENFEVVTGEPDRTPGGRVVSSDPTERTQRRLKERLAEAGFAYSRAVSFFNLGK